MVTLPFLQASEAIDRVLKILAAQSHLSIRASICMLSFQPVRVSGGPSVLYGAKAGMLVRSEFHFLL